jgi:hypothetical protein
MASRRRQRVPVRWEKLPDEQLLQIRVRDLGLRIEGSPLEAPIGRLYAELDARGIGFHPPCYLADEWFCPDKVPVIGIPFFLAHRRLRLLEKKMMLEVEGGTDSSCMKLLRHEAGHALNYAYRLFGRTRWRELFGPFSAKYHESYAPRPYSKRYVSHLRHNYAQAHPDEDFAETFAVWLSTGERWKQKYRDWPALKKLRYVDHVVARIGQTPPPVGTRQTPYSADRMTSTLGAYYQRKRRHLGEEFPGFYDPGLERLFSPRSSAPSGERASAFLRRWRRQLLAGVATWTGDRKYDIDGLLRKLIRRCDALDLAVGRGEPEMACELGAFVAAVMNNIHRFRELSEEA